MPSGRARCTKRKALAFPMNSLTCAGRPAWRFGTTTQLRFEVGYPWVRVLRRRQRRMAVPSLRFSDKRGGDLWSFVDGFDDRSKMRPQGTAENCQLNLWPPNEKRSAHFIFQRLYRIGQ
jgi:hypothetical protein